MLRSQLLWKVGLFILLAASVALPFVHHMQAQSPHRAIPISADNISQLQSVWQLDYADLPAEIVPASGIFLITPDAEQVVTFGSFEGEPPFSQAILWNTGNDVAVNRIADSSLARTLTEDGQCLLAGYLGSVVVYQFQPESSEATVLYGPYDLLSAHDAVGSLWMDDAFTCTSDFFVEVVAEDGHLYSMQASEEGLVLVHDNLLPDMDDSMAARVGRVPPPVALTLDFDGTISRWDMDTNAITAQVNVGTVAMFGAINTGGGFYTWQAPDRSGVHLVDFTTETDREIATYDDVYLSHLALPPSADVILGIDPTDARGTISAWPVASGERLDLGAYRECERIQPDLARLSTNGTALVIGCDTGIDVWRVVLDSSGEN